jgi:hypothetical protein
MARVEGGVAVVSCSSFSGLVWYFCRTLRGVNAQLLYLRFRSFCVENEHW